MLMPAIDVLLETSAVVTTVVQFLSGVIVCRKYFSKKSTGESSGVPFICGFLSCSLWLRYGLLTSEQSVVLVNIIGACLFFIYTIIYYVFCINKNTHLKQFFFALAAIVAVVVYTSTPAPDNPQKNMHIMGIFCCIVSVLFFAAPLTNLLHVIRVKNAESLPFPLIVMSFITSLLWVLYGILISDTFIQLPNFLGCVLSMLQLCLFVVYPPKTFSGPGYKLLDQSVIY